MNGTINAKEVGQMIEKDICENGRFKVYRGACTNGTYGTDFYSEGIKRLCQYEEGKKIVDELACRYYENQDPGTAYSWDEEHIKARHLTQGQLRGSYNTDFGKIVIEPGPAGIGQIMCFFFER